MSDRIRYIPHLTEEIKNLKTVTLDGRTTPKA